MLNAHFQEEYKQSDHAVRLRMTLKVQDDNNCGLSVEVGFQRGEKPPCIDYYT